MKAPICFNFLDFLYKPNRSVLKGSLPTVPVFFVAMVHWALKCRLGLKNDFQVFSKNLTVVQVAFRSLNKIFKMTANCIQCPKGKHMGTKRRPNMRVL